MTHPSPRPGSERRDGPPAQLRVAVLGVGSLAVVAAILLGIVVLRGDPGGPAAVNPSSSPSPSPSSSGDLPSEPSASAAPSRAPSATAAPDPTATPLPSGAAPLAWSEGTPPDGEVRVVTWIDDRWLAVGSNGERAAVWSSEDGLTWTSSHPIPPEPVAPTETDPGTGYWITELVAHDGTLLAFGWNRIGCCDGGEPMAWRSTDGVTWEVVPTDGTAFDEYQFPVAAVVAGDGSLVLAGVTGLGHGWAALTTSDGVTWSRAEVTDPEDWASVAGLAASPTTVLAVGTRTIPGDEVAHVPVTWLSSDGRTWSPGAFPDEAGSLSSVIWNGTSRYFLAVGQDDEARAAVWRTADGRSWSRLTFDPRPGVAIGIDSAQRLMVAAGNVGGEAGTLLAWSSHDGVTWQIAELRDGHYTGVLVGSGDGGAVIFADVLLDPNTGQLEREVWSGVP